MRSLILTALAMLSTTIASAQAPLSAIGTPTVIDFSTTVTGVNQGLFTAAAPIGGTSPTDGQLDFDGWNYTTDAAPATATQGAANFPGAVPNGNGLGTAGSLTGGISAVDVNGNRALAIQPIAGHWTSGSLTLRAQNNTAGSIEQVDVSYTIHVWNDADRGNEVRFYYSLSAAQDSWVEITDARVLSPTAAVLPASWEAHPVSFSLSGFSINPGDIIYLRWVGSDVDGSNTRDEFAFDDISLTPQVATGPLVIASVTALPPFAQTQGTPSTAQNFIMAGNNLTANATVAVAAPFEVSLTEASGYTSSLNVVQSGGAIAPTTIYVRLNSPGAGSFNEIITISSTGAGNALVGVSGTTTSNVLPELYINELMPVNVSTIADGSGDFDPWFEIYNAESDPVDVAGFYVTDDLGQPTNYQFPSGAQTIIPAHGFLLVWADNEPQEGDLHASFTLSPTGGTLALVATDGSTVVDQITYAPVPADQSYGREMDGNEPWVMFTTTTPGSTNHTDGIIERGLPMLHVWPSPATERLFLDLPCTGHIVDAHGRTVMSVRQARTIDVQSLPAGDYVLRSDTGAAVRFVKLR